MQQISQRFQELYESEADQEVKVVIGSTIYEQDRIVSIRTNGSIFANSDPGVGGVIERMLDLTVRASSSDIPRSARMMPALRLVPPVGEPTEWLAKGVFFVASRQEDKEDGVVKLTGYDCLRKTNQDYMQSGEQGSWPKIDIDVVNHICARIGSELDERTAAILTSRYSIPYPGYGEGAFTMREVLGYIGALYAGNWITTDAGKVYLAQLGGLPAETHYLIEEHGRAITIGGVRILV